MNLISEESATESWNIYRREEIENRIYKVRNSFTVNIKKILNQFLW